MPRRIKQHVEACTGCRERQIHAKSGPYVDRICHCSRFRWLRAWPWGPATQPTCWCTQRCTGCPALLGPPCQMAAGLPLLGDSASASSLPTGFLLLDRVEDWVPALNSSNPVVFTNLPQHQGVQVEGLTHRRFIGVKFINVPISSSRCSQFVK